MHLPAALAGSVRDDERMRAWAAGLDAHGAAVEQRWGLRLDAPYEPGGMTAWVAPARTAAGERVVVKIASRSPETAHEAEGLRVWDGAGAVRLLDSTVLTDDTAVLILEPCEPGTSAADLDPFAADEVLAGVLRRLWVPAPTGHPFRPLADMVTQWLDEFDADAATDRIGDAGIVSAGAQLFAELGADVAEPVLLATDLHAENVLAARREPWLAIDPKPYVGDRTYDAVQHLLNDDDRLRADPLAWVRRMAALLDLDAARLRDWLFARCVIEVRWFAAAAEVARRLA